MKSKRVEPFRVYKMDALQNVDGRCPRDSGNDPYQSLKLSHPPQHDSPAMCSVRLRFHTLGWKRAHPPAAKRSPLKWFPGDAGGTMLLCLPGSGFLLFSSGRSSEAKRKCFFCPRTHWIRTETYYHSSPSDPCPLDETMPTVSGRAPRLEGRRGEVLAGRG